MKILLIISITFLIVFAVGCDEMQNQVMKPPMVPDNEAPTEDSTVTSVGTMKDPSTETDGTKEDASTETMEEDPPDEPQIPDAVFVSATPASGNISKNDSITITFDNDPGAVSVNIGTVAGSGNSRTISGPFSVGSLTLTISWTNGSGSRTLTYTVEAEIPDATFVSATPASGNIKENDSITITFDNDPGDVTVSPGTVTGSGNSRTISGPFSVGSLTLTISWTNGSSSRTLNYNVEGPPVVPQTPDAVFVSATPASGNIKENDSITITFDNDPGNVTVSAGTVTGSGNSRTISGPFSVGSLTLTISWTNGSSSRTLNYNVEGPPVVPQTPDAVFVSATPASGNIKENDSITITFDNDPGAVSVNIGTVAGSGNSRTISGPFSVGSLTLTISWINGSGRHMLSYNVTAADSTSPEVTTSSTTDGAEDVDPDEVSENGITVTFSEPISSGVLKLLKGGSDVGWKSTISGNTITLTKDTGQELSHGTTYVISGTVSDSTGNETDVSITFTTESAPVTPAQGEGLSIGAEAPDFTLSDSDGNTYTLSDNIGSSNIVIVFYRGWW